MSAITPLRFSASNPALKGGAEEVLTLDQVESWTGRLLAGANHDEGTSEGVMFRSGDVLFSKLRPYLAKSVRPRRDGVASTEFIVLRPDRQLLDARFLHYATLSKPFVEWASATSYGTKMPRTNWDSIGRFELWSPPLETQRRIADMLDAETARIDALIEKNRKAVDLLARRLRSYRAQLLWPAEAAKAWTGNPLAAPPSAAPDVARLQYVVPFRVAGGTPKSTNREFWTDDPDAGVPWFAVGDLKHGGATVSPSRYVTAAGMEKANLSQLPPGTILYAMYASIGKATILQTEGVTNQAILGLRPDSGLLAEYLFNWMLFTRPFAVELARSNTQDNLNAEQVARFTIRVPSVPEQRRMVEEIRSVEESLTSLETKVRRQEELLTKRRQALITGAVTGEIDV